MRPRLLHLGYLLAAVAVHAQLLASMRPRLLHLGYGPPYNLLFPKAISPCFRAMVCHTNQTPPHDAHPCLHHVKKLCNSNMLKKFERGLAQWRHRPARNTQASIARDSEATQVHVLNALILLYHGRLAFHLRKTFADAFHGQMNFIGRADINQKNVILAIFHQLAQPCFQFGAPPPSKPALKDGKLKPFAIALHGFEHAPPAPLIGNVVGHDIKPFIAHAAGLNGLSGCCDCAPHDGASLMPRLPMASSQRGR